MLSQEQVLANKERYLELVRTITRFEDVEYFIDWLEHGSDFFSAPASSQYHCSYAGGLCEHSLNVYDNLVKICNSLGVTEYDNETLLIVSLFHDLSKTNFYEKCYRNVKNSETGNWESVMYYGIRKDEGKLVYGNHEQNSLFIISNFLKLNRDEGSAILHHHAGMSWDSAKEDVSVVFNAYPIATLLHMADLASTFITEKQ